MQAPVATWTQQAELTASDGTAFDKFGWSVAISGDTALVGAPQHAVGSNAYQGAAYVFAGSGSTWTQRAELTAADGAAWDKLGSSVALSGDTAVIGAPRHVVGSTFHGAAYVFAGSGGTWTQQAELTASDGAAWDFFGFSVAISGDTALVGAPSHAVSGNSQQGTAYVFAGSGSTWTQQAELSASDGAAGDNFGWAVAFSGNSALVGALYHAVGGNPLQGAAYVFVNAPTTPPTTTVSGLPAHWVRHAVTLHFTAAPAAEGAPVAYTEHRLGSGAWTKGTSVTVKRQGATTLSYRSADTDNNLEVARSCIVRIDTTPPKPHMTLHCWSPSAARWPASGSRSATTSAPPVR